MKDTDNISIKSRSRNYISEEKNEAKKNLETKFETRPIFKVRPKFGLRLKLRPKLRTDQL